jgi:hypothetical protein
VTTRTQKQLAQVLLAQTKMETEAQHQEGTDGFGRGARIAAFVRRSFQNFFCDLAVLTNRAVCLEHDHDRFKRVAMNAGDTLHHISTRQYARLVDE